MQALDSRIQSQQSQRDKAKTDFDRAVELQRRGVSTQVQVDAAKTALDVAERTLAAMRLGPRRRRPADERRRRARAGGRPRAEGPGVRRLGRAARRDDRDARRGPLHPAPATAGAARAVHARRRCGADRRARPRGRRAPSARGGSASSIPRSRAGGSSPTSRSPALGDYFVGERTRVYVTTGMRARDHRSARLSSTAAPASITPGSKDGTRGRGPARRAREDSNVEILAGLRDGDELVVAMKLGLSGVLTRAFINSPLTPLLLARRARRGR